MHREIIIPDSEEHWLALRQKDLTSTDIACLFGIGYWSLFELWHYKASGVKPDFEPNERTEFGLFLQDGIAAKFAKDNNWKIRRMNEYIRLPELRLGASFDFDVNDVDLAEIKNVDGLVFKKDWIVNDDKSIEASPKIEIQVQAQMLVSGRERAFICACVGGNRGVKLERTANPAIQEAIKTKADAFWKSIDENNPPEPNFETDAKFIASLYNYAAPGSIISVAGDEEILKMVERYREGGELIKAAESRREEIKARLLTLIGEAEKADGGSFTISA